MLLGIGFVTVVTASITSSFVGRSRHESTLDSAPAPSWEDELREIDKRLEWIEAAVTARL